MVIFFIVIASIFVALIIVSIVLSLYILRRFFGRRYNGSSYVKYFKSEDFEGLNASPVSFHSECGDLLRGYVYSAAGKNETVGLIIFSHGFGAGHLSYTTEINTFAKHGFKVLAFDNTGCVSSEGNTIKGFDQGVSDLVSAVAYAKSDESLKNLPIALVGHSWGGFSVMNAFPLCENISCAVAICGFISSADVISQNAFGKIFPVRFISKIIFKLRNKIVFGSKANYNSLKSLKNVEKPVFLLYGKKDKTVLWKKNGLKMAETLKDNPFLKINTYDEKAHNVYLTVQAEKLLNSSFADAASKAKKCPAEAEKYYKDIDYKAITEEDEQVMNEIISFISDNLKK